MAKAGWQVTIYERGSEWGGLASGFRINGAPLEKAYHHLFRTDTDIISIVEELGLQDKLQWHTSSLGLYYGGKMYPFITPLDLLRFTPLSFFNRLRAGVVALFLQKWPFWRGFLHISAYDWMRRFGGAQVTKVIWEPLLKGKFDRYYDKVAMAWLWARIHTRGNSKAPGEFDEKLGYFDGGFVVLIEELQRRLKELGVEMVLGASVESLTSVDNGAAVTVNSEQKLFDQVLATVPMHVFANLVREQASENYLQQLNSIDYIGAAVMIFSSQQSLSKYYWHNINDLQAPFLVFIEHTNLIDKNNYGNEHVYYVGTYVPHDHKYFEMANEELENSWLNYLKNIFPDFDSKLISEKYLFKFKYAQHIVDVDYENKIPDYKTPLNNIYLANFAQIFPEDRGTNFAVREGNKLAKLILEHSES